MKKRADTKEKDIPSDLRWEFEKWLRFNLPWQFRASRSKKYAMERFFYHFSDYVRPVIEKAPKEFNAFFFELKKRSQKIATWRAPRGHRVIDGSEKYPNGEPRVSMIKISE